MKKGERNIYIGCSGWSYKHWKGKFYPENLSSKKWFEFYAETFNTVEINYTFYKLPPEETFVAWAEKAKQDFIYSVKASRYLTHIRRLKDAEESVNLILSRARLLKEHLGPVLYQLPPNWDCDAARLEGFLKLLPKDLTHVFEFRDQRWLDDEVFALLEEHGVNHCIHDKAGLEVPRRAVGPVIYVRFHGGSGDEGSYTESALAEWARWLRNKSETGDRDIYAYFNNDYEAHAVFNAQSLRKKLME